MHFFAGVVTFGKSIVMQFLQPFILSLFFICYHLGYALSWIGFVSHGQSQISHWQYITKTHLGSIFEVFTPAYTFKNCSWSCEHSSIMKLNICKNGILNLKVNVVSTSLFWLHFLVESLAYFVLDCGVVDRIILPLNFRNHFVKEISIWKIIEVHLRAIISSPCLNHLHRLTSCLNLVSKSSHIVIRVIYISSFSKC